MKPRPVVLDPRTVAIGRNLPNATHYFISSSTVAAVGAVSFQRIGSSSTGTYCILVRSCGGMELNFVLVRAWIIQQDADPPQ
jgi:hypothetical protein